jgi:hypothetical protein
VPASAIDQAAQGGEQLGHALNLVENDEPVFVAGEERIRIGQFSPILAGFKIQVDRRRFRGNRKGQRRLSDLARAGESYGGLPRQRIVDGGSRAAGNQPCILSMAWMICKDNVRQQALAVYIQSDIIDPCGWYASLAIRSSAARLSRECTSRRRLPTG